MTKLFHCKKCNEPIQDEIADMIAADLRNAVIIATVAYIKAQTERKKEADGE